MRPKIVLPAPGLPTIVEGPLAALRLTVARGSASDSELQSWARDLQLCSRSTGTCSALVFDGLQPSPPAASERLSLAHASPWDEDPGGLTDLFLRSPSTAEPQPPREVELYDILRGTGIERAGCIACMRGTGRQDLRLLFASDLHLARLWTDLEVALEQYAPEVAAVMLRPAELARRFVDIANRMADRGELELVVFGGDLVDHAFASPRRLAGGAEPESNVRLVDQMLRSLRVPAFAITGNHDYRAFPWRPQNYGLEALGIDLRESRSALRRAGMWSPVVMRRSDFDAVRTSGHDGQPALLAHLRDISPATDYHVDLRGLRLIFACSGPDAFVRPNSVGRARLGLLARSAATCWHDPDSVGLSLRQLRLIEGALESGRGSALIVHAPLLHDPSTRPMAGRLPMPEYRTWAEGGSSLPFERKIRRMGLRRGVMFRHPAQTLKLLTEARTPLAVFSGHVHRPTATLLDPKSLELRAISFSEVPLQQGPLLLTSPSLTQLRMDHGAPPGYLSARFERGRLARLSVEGLWTG